MSPTTAVTDAPILDVLAERWSTRIFDPSAPVDDEALRSALEAARWAPSANNSQPWRFVVAHRGTEAHARVLATLTDSNRTWAAAAGALVVFAAATAIDGRALTWAAYDTGQAAAFFTVQAHSDGLHTHQMGGFDRELLAKAFDLAPGLTPLTVMAVGALGDPREAPAALRERESTARVRRSVDESLIADD